jgi:hypothetical protein
VVAKNNFWGKNMGNEPPATIAYESATEPAAARANGSRASMMDVLLLGGFRTVYGILNPANMWPANGSPRYVGPFHVLDETIAVTAHTSRINGTGAHRTTYANLATALEEAQRAHPDVKGLLLTCADGLDGALEGCECWESVWRPYTLP